MAGRFQRDERFTFESFSTLCQTTCQCAGEAALKTSSSIKFLIKLFNYSKIVALEK